MEKYIICLGLIGLVLFLPVKFKIKIEFDLLNNKGKLKLYLVNLKFVNLSFSLRGKSLIITKKNGKKRLVGLVGSGDESNFEDNFGRELIKNLTVKNAYLFSNIGARSNAFLTSMLTGTAQIISAILFSFLKAKKKPIIINNVYPKFDEEMFDFTIKLRVKINLFKLTKSFIKAIKKAKFKSKKEGKSYV
jgi:hypothetical protein